MGRPSTFSFPAASTTALAASQTLASSGSLNLNGSLSTTGDLYTGFLPFNARGSNVVCLAGIQRVCTLSSGANLSGINFTWVGYDSQGLAVTEVLAGPSGNTVSTANEYAIVRSITSNAAVASAVTAGTGASGSTQWWPVNLDTVAGQITAMATVSATGTINYTAQYTNDYPPTTASGTVNDGTIAAQTTTKLWNIGYQPGSIRLKINSSSGAGSLTFVVQQSGLAV